MSSELAIKVDSLSKAYHIYNKPHERFLQLINWRSRQYFSEFWALRDISLEVHKGETVGIVGKNGSGKSTLLQIICGTLSQTSGQVESAGKIAALLELGSGFNPEFTGRENVLMYASILGLSEELIAQRFENIVAFADIGEFLDQPVKTYSSGMVVRLAFAVIAHVDADILIIDEALAVGDIFFVQKCMRFLNEFKKHGTLLFVSHDSSAVVNFCDKAVWLDKGRIELTGSAKQVTERYLETLYAGQNSIENELSADIVQAFAKAKDKASAPSQRRDARLEYINLTQYRNDLELFEFKDDCESFGSRRGEIIGAKLMDESLSALSWAVGGELVTLQIVCFARQKLHSPIVGFHFKNRLGQRLFGDNTYLSYKNQDFSVAAGESFTATFTFLMPRLERGDYAFDVALAEGVQENHEMLHWKYDALVLVSHSSSVTSGLVGIPMIAIDMALADTNQLEKDEPCP
jgi:lipopolysaccharide transport system ATP-binding protein